MPGATVSLCWHSWKCRQGRNERGQGCPGTRKQGVTGAVPQSGPGELQCHIATLHTPGAQQVWPCSLRLAGPRLVLGSREHYIGWRQVPWLYPGRAGVGLGVSVGPDACRRAGEGLGGWRGRSRSPVPGGKAGDGRPEGWMDHVSLCWISPSWPRLLGMEVLEKGRQLPQSSPAPLHPAPQGPVC